MSSIIPLSHFSRLSLGSMAPRTRSANQHLVATSLSTDGVPRNVEVDLGFSSQDEASDVSTDDHEHDEDDEEEDDEDEDTRTIVRSSTTRLSYDMSNLDADTRSELRQLFRETPPSEPPSLVLQWCQLSQEQEDEHSRFYAFQLHEVVPRSIRIGSPGSKYRHPRCNCMQDNDKPCRHLIYLLDQINSVTSDQLPNMPVQKIEASGVPAGLGQPFEKISNFHLDLLAGSLHCDVGPPHSKLETNPVRLQETREILESITEQDGDDLSVKDYRNDIFDKSGSNLRDHDIITYNDLTDTVTRMLATNNDFFAYFLKLLPASSIAKDPFHKIQQHVDRVLQGLRDHSQVMSLDSTTFECAEGSQDVPWAAAHIRRAVAQIQHLLQNRDDAPSPAERASAARTLVQILHSVVFDWNCEIPRSSKSAASPTATGTIETNLYQRLIGSSSSPPAISASSSQSFILNTLAQLPEQNQWIETLERIEVHLSGCDAPTIFMRRLREIIVLMRSSRPTAAVTASTLNTAESFKKRASASGNNVSRRTSSLGSKRSSAGGSGREGGAKRAR